MPTPATTVKNPRAFPFKLGADPEFNITMQGKRIAAYDIIQRVLHGKYKQVEGGFNIKDYGNFGWDGHSPTGEIRPKPSGSPEELTENIKGLFEAFVKEIGLFDLSVLSFRASVGGHIHFDLPTTKTFNDKTTYSLHKKLAGFYLPVLLSENRINILARLKGGYGKMGDCRLNSSISEINKPYTYEFRTPSAEWLTTPQITLATLAYFGTIYNEIINRPDNFAKLAKDLQFKSNVQGDALQGLVLSRYEALSKFILGMIKKILPQFEYYPAFKEEIDYILKPDKVLADKTAANFNIVKGWKFKQGARPDKRMLLSNKLLKERSKKINLDSLSPLITIGYNADTNVELFVKTIKERILLLNWQLNNNYYFFGLRAGIKDFIVTDLNAKIIYSGSQIKTPRDQDATRALFIRMGERSGLATDHKLPGAKPVLLVGIPYALRQANDIKSFVSFIHQLEVHNDPESPADLKTNSKEPSKLAEILLATDQKQIRVDEGVSDEFANAQEEINEENNNEIRETGARDDTFMCTNCSRAFTPEPGHTHWTTIEENGPERTIPYYPDESGTPQNTFCPLCGTTHAADIIIYRC